MTAISDYLEDALLDHVLRNTPLASPVTVYLALFVDDPTDADTGTEVSGGSYARQAVTFSAPSGGRVSNSSAVTFPVASADWGSISHVGIYDASSGGNLLFHGKLAVGRIILSGQQIAFAAATIVVELL